MKRAFTIGIDYGTNSVRSVVFDCADGREVGTSVFDYPSGDQGILLDPGNPHLARQNPADYVAGLEASVKGALAEAASEEGFSAGRGDRHRRGHHRLDADPGERREPAPRPRSRWKDNLAAHAWLWKDHTAAEEAAAITAIARDHAPEYLAPIGGIYSSEWFWSKIWHCLKVAPDVFEAAASWVELRGLRPRGAGRHQGPGADPALRVRRRPQGHVLRRLGRACRRRSSWPASTRGWPTSATGSSRRRTPPTGRPGC